MDRQTDWSTWEKALEKQLIEGRRKRSRRWLYPKDARLIGIPCSIPITGFIRLLTIW